MEMSAAVANIVVYHFWQQFCVLQLHSHQAQSSVVLCLRGFILFVHGDKELKQGI